MDGQRHKLNGGTVKHRGSMDFDKDQRPCMSMDVSVLLNGTMVKDHGLICDGHFPCNVK